MDFIGIGQGRITQNLGTFVEHLSGSLSIADEKSLNMVYDLLDSEGLYIGASSALNVVAAYELAQKLGPGELNRDLLACLTDRNNRKDHCDDSVRRCLSVPESTILQEMARIQRFRECTTFTLKEVRSIGLMKCMVLQGLP